MLLLLLAAACCALPPLTAARYYPSSTPYRDAVFPTAAPGPQDFDIVIYGSTLCGVTGLAAAAAAPGRPRVALVSRAAHIGGMTSGGLSGMDLRMPVGGLFADLLRDILSLPANASIPDFPNFEPKVAQAAIDRLLNRTLALYPSTAAVFQDAGAIVNAARGADPERLAQFTTATNNATFRGRYFVDCSYEGDLLQASGSPFRVGREPRSAYNESNAGAEGEPFASGRFPASVSPFVAGSGTQLLPGIVPPPAPEQRAAGGGDGLVQSYNFRMCLSNRVGNRANITPPADYLSRAELLRRWLLSLDERAAAALDMDSLFLIRHLPNDKIDLNSGPAPVSTDMPFLQFEYPTANWSRRAEIWAEHRDWTAALLYFLQTNESVPAQLRGEMASFGLCADEWVDNAHWPPELYVRESVRLVGQHTLTEAEVFGGKVGNSSEGVGLSCWLVDIHDVQRVVVDGVVVNAGNRNTGGKTWQLTEIPYGALVPERSGGGVLNLLVPVCVSSTHVAFATYRLEPQYAIFGQSAAVAAAQALAAGGQAVQDVDVQALRAELRRQGQLLDAGGGGGGGGPQAVLADCGGKEGGREWWVDKDGDRTLRVDLGTGPGLCLSVYGYSREAGAQMWIVACHTADRSPAHQNQEFEVVGGGTIRSVLSGLCVEGGGVGAWGGGGGRGGGGGGVVQGNCSASGAVWRMPAVGARGQIVHVETGLCLAYPGS